MFGTVLTDRGPEFSDVAGMERDGRCSVYFADPMRSDQKGACEKNHIELRKIVPKGTSLDGPCVFDSLHFTSLSTAWFRKRARKIFGFGRGCADRPTRPTVVVASVATIGGQEG